MTFTDLIGQVRQSPLEQLRVCTGDYLEAVVATDQMEQLNPILSSYFGHPFKPEGQPPFPEALSSTEAYGGVHDSQTLYMNTNSALKEIALLWPWGSGSAVTLKIARG